MNTMKDVLHHTISLILLMAAVFGLGLTYMNTSNTPLWQNNDVVPSRRKAPFPTDSTTKQTSWGPHLPILYGHVHMAKTGKSRSKHISLQCRCNNIIAYHYFSHKLTVCSLDIKITPYCINRWDINQRYSCK